ncbi:hypothetical protein KKE68_04285, partial [Patescibacteria group bacterium]|nr:hypothetical protein [Patescibacteria group bacterium]
ISAMRKKQLAIIISLLIIFAIGAPLTLFILNKQQETRSRANVSTSLSFFPNSTINAPIQKNIGDPVSIDIMVNPGLNLISFVRFQIKYDPSKLALANINAFVPNTTAFPNTIEGPITTNDTLAASVSIGSDPTKVIQTTTKLGTLNFKAIGTTGDTPTQITYTALTQTLSTESNDQASENSLSTTTPAIIAIISPTPTPQPTNTPTPTPRPTSTPTPRPTSTPTPTPTPAITRLSITIYHHGIWDSGDNTNPTNTSLSNKNPVHKTINADLELFNTANQLVAQGHGPITYATKSGNFQGTIIGIYPDTFPSGQYYLKVKTNFHLRKRVPGILTIIAGQKNTIPAATLITGDANNDNMLNILDYNSILNCYSDLAPAAACNDIQKKTASDINDDGAVNQFDYNLFLRELATQPGQ